MPTVLLKDIASIHTGYTFRGSIEPDEDGELRVVQIKDLVIGKPIPYVNLVQTSLDNVRRESFIQNGDVLFISRGTRNQAIPVEQDFTNVIFGAQILAVRTGDKVLPSYLACYLNLKPAQRYLEEYGVGSNVRVVTKSILEEMPVAVPPIEVQKRIVALCELSFKEERLMEEIKTKRKQLVEEALAKVLKQEN